jgi:hypothetical protein
MLRPNAGRGKKARRIPRPVKGALISALALLVLFVGGGVAYTIFQGQTPAKPIVAPAVPKTQEFKPPQPAANARESAAVEVVTSPVAAGKNTMLTIATLPKSVCKITFTYNNIASKDTGLKDKIADDYGTVSWAWTIDKATPLGTWPATVTCAHNSLTAVVTSNIEVTAATAAQ